MKIIPMLRGVGLLALGLAATACDDGLQVHFAEPFPAQAADLPAFPARYQAVYTAADSTSSMCIGRTAVWHQQLRSMTFVRDSAHRGLRADTTYAENGQLHYLKILEDGLVRDSWLDTDTIFSLAGSEPSVLRRFQGRYYLNTPDESREKWDVQRLEIDGSNLRWQTFGTDTLRLLALDPATVRYRREHGRLTSLQLTPATGQQTRRLGRYDGLWDTEEEFVRRR